MRVLLNLATGPGMHHVYHQMLLAGELRARSTRRMLVQDIVFMRGQRRKGLYPTIASFGASASVTWTDGRLVASREGPCVCSAQVWDNVDIGSCAECLTQPDRVHKEIMVKRRVEVVGFHFQVFKMAWRQSSKRTNLEDFVPSFERCAAVATAPRATNRSMRVVVDMQRGFRCMAP